MLHALQAELLSRLLAQSPASFEQAIIDLLIAMGYGGSEGESARRLGGAGDGGVDGVIDEDRLGLDRIYIHAKRYASGTSVGRPELQAFVGSLVGFAGTKGVFVTTSTFSRPAIDYVKNLQHRIVLIDGQRMAELMFEYRVGVLVSRIVEIKSLDENFFDN